MSAALTWFGGKRGVVQLSDPELRLHLSPSRGRDTLCGLSDGLRAVTLREANRDGCWCETCLRIGQSA